MNTKVNNNEEKFIRVLNLSLLNELNEYIKENIVLKYMYEEDKRLMLFVIC